MFSANQSAPDVLEFEQILALLTAAKSSGELHWLSQALAFIHALRASEVVGIKPANIKGNRLSLPRKKHSNPVDDELLISEFPVLNVRQAVIGLALKTPSNQSLFNITTRTFQRWVHKAGALASLPEEWCHPHTLKHSILDHLHMTGMDLVQMQNRSGHKSLDSLRVYLHPKKVVTDALVGARLGVQSA